MKISSSHENLLSCKVELAADRRLKNRKKIEEDLFIISGIVEFRHIDNPNNKRFLNC